MRARLNGKGDIAAPGAPQIAGRSFDMRRADLLTIDCTGFIGLDTLDETDVVCSEGLTVSRAEVSGAFWMIVFEGAGRAQMSFRSKSGKTWSGSVRVRAR